MSTTKDEKTLSTIQKLLGAFDSRNHGKTIEAIVEYEEALLDEIRDRVINHTHAEEIHAGVLSVDEVESLIRLEALKAIKVLQETKAAVQLSILHQVFTSGLFSAAGAPSC